MSDDDTTPDGFRQTVRRTLACAGFVPPGAGEACVLVFDSSMWVAHAAAAEGLLDHGEHCRVARFRFDRDRSTYTLAHALWRMTLGVCLETEASMVSLVSTPSGQPQLPGTRLATSLSHSGSWVAIAMGAADTLGVDIERAPSRIALSDLLMTICTSTEAADMQKLPLPAREHAQTALAKRLDVHPTRIEQWKAQRLERGAGGPRLRSRVAFLCAAVRCQGAASENR